MDKTDPSGLRAFRAKHGLMAKDVASILGYSRSYISRCETGYRHLSRNAWKLLEAHVAQEQDG